MGVKNTQFNTKSSWFSEYVSGKYVGYHSEQLTDATPSDPQPTGMTATGGIIGDWAAPTGEFYRSHVFTSSGNIIHYAQLIVCTGSKPKLLGIPGVIDYASTFNQLEARVAQLEQIVNN